MHSNPYAPPKSEVADIQQTAVAPPLWNPNAAANWSLLFSPAFGAFLHMKNWQALGESTKASAAKTWAVVSLSLILGLSALSALAPTSSPFASMPRSVGLILLLTWYFTSAREQAKYVKEQFGKEYPRRGWAKPLLLALLVFLGFFVVIFIVAAFSTLYR